MQQQQKKQPKSWELRKKDPAQYKFSNQTNQTLVKKPGTIAGDQFNLENCKNCNIYILDNSNTVYVDDCVDCNILLGPIESSVFIRDCQRCRFVIACGQYRIRNCEDLKVLLMCQSQPIIESSIRIGFGCFRAAYPEFEEQLNKAQIDRWNNTWSDIFDFTPQFKLTQNHHYQLMEDIVFSDFLPPISKVYPEVTYDWENDISNQVIPFSYEIRNKNIIEELLIIFYPEFTKNNNFNLLTQYFQPIYQQPDDYDGDLFHNGEVVIQAPETSPFYLVKSKHNFLFPENYEIFKQTINDFCPKNISEKLMSQIVVNDHLQKMFSLQIRTDNEEVRLYQLFKSIFESLFSVSFENSCIIFKSKQQIQTLAQLVFANMQDEKGQKNPFQK